MNAVTTCNTCHHAARPLPTDWMAVDFSDRPILAQEAVFRTECTAVPDAEKPCLKPAPAANAITLTERQKIGLQATYPAESLLRTLLRTAHHGEMEELPFLMRAMLPRLLELNSVSMSAHDPDSDDLPSIREQLHGGYQHLALGAKGGAA